uniref:S-methyl-5'-thioadenosine phosphorylase n=1 Tax=Ciona intestinalis TaxID=7719 RepID=I6L212_CIOIN
MESGDRQNNKIGIIGGSGLESIELFTVKDKVNCNTPYGKPSSSLINGTLNGIECVLLSRHGDSHDIMPTDVNYRANLYALKEAGCSIILATTACGSLQEELKPTDFVVIDQFIDRTTKRHSTFYDGQNVQMKGVCHIPMRNPFCEKLQNVLLSACNVNNVSCHSKGTMVTIEGPRFSTYAESNLFRKWGGSLINMTTVPEVVLANELGMLYAALAMVTDYDCWKEDHASVNVENVMKTMKVNRGNALKVLVSAVEIISKQNLQPDIQLAEKNAKNSVMLPLH